MKKYTGTFFEVISKDNSYKLADRLNTFEDAKKYREESIQRQVDRGYTPDKLIITRTIWSRVFTDDDEFYSETSDTVRMEEN